MSTQTRQRDDHPEAYWSELGLLCSCRLNLCGLVQTSELVRNRPHGVPITTRAEHAGDIGLS